MKLLIRFPASTTKHSNRVPSMCCWGYVSHSVKNGVRLHVKIASKATVQNAYTAAAADNNRNAKKKKFPRPSLRTLTRRHFKTLGILFKIGYKSSDPVDRWGVKVEANRIEQKENNTQFKHNKFSGPYHFNSVTTSIKRVPSGKKI